MTTEHIVTSYEDELASLDSKIAQMGGLTETLVAQAFDALCKGDVASANNVILDDAKIDEFELEIEEQAVTMIARRQPMALDLRQIMVAIKITSDLERIGDLAKNIARRSIAVANEDHRTTLRGIERMGQAVSRLLQVALDAYQRREPVTALSVLDQDEDIDSHYNSLLRSMLVFVAEEPDQLHTRSNFIFIVKNLERIGDHCTNIAKVVHFIATGLQVGEAETLIRPQPE